MVCLKNFAIIPLVACLATALPVAEDSKAVSTSETTPDLLGLTPSDYDLLESKIASLDSADHELVARETVEVYKRGGPIGTILGLVATIVQFLTTTLANVLSLRLDKQADATVQLLIDLNKFLYELLESLKEIEVTRGLAGILQKLLLNTGLQGIVLSLTTTVGQVVSVLLKGKDITPQAKAQISELISVLEKLQAALNEKGISKNVGRNLGDLINKLLGLL